MQQQKRGEKFCPTCGQKTVRQWRKRGEKNLIIIELILQKVVCNPQQQSDCNNKKPTQRSCEKRGEKSHSFAVRKEKIKTLKTALLLAFKFTTKNENKKSVGFLKPKKRGEKLFATSGNKK